jgi:hypothetical protein
MRFRIHRFVAALISITLIKTFMHELLYLRGGQAGDAHAFLVGRVTQRCQRNIPNLIIICKMLYTLFTWFWID